MIRTVKSILAAALGVQSSANREHDFENGKASSFIIGGIVFTVLFIVTLLSIVTYITSS